MTQHPILFSSPMVQAKEILRTLGFYQPFCTLMLHGKVETRWVRVGKKPPFPKGKYLFYSTKEPCDINQMIDFCGAGNGLRITIEHLLLNDETKNLNGYGLATGVLRDIRLMTKKDEGKTFVEFKGIQIRQDKNGVNHSYQQWCLEFEDVRAIEPIKFTHGKQGVGFLKDEYTLRYTNQDYPDTDKSFQQESKYL